MQFLIADTFQKSVNKLGSVEQKIVKETTYDFQINPKNPGIQLHRVKGTSENFWTGYVNDDIRIIVYQDGDTYVFCYAGHHDDAYRWAERRKLSVHPDTGAVQLVETEERTEEIVQHIYKQVEKEEPLFNQYEASYLRKIGVPPEWLDALRHVGETGFLKLADELPEEVSERLWDLLDGVPVKVPNVQNVNDPFEHPDSQRRFRIIEDESELRQALEWPMERWTTFLHPRQQDAVKKHYRGPAFVSGGAGTGKTVVAMHRVRKLLKDYPDNQVLFTTFSKTLSSRLVRGCNILLGEDNPLRQRLDIVHLHKLARKLWVDHHGTRLDIIDQNSLRELLDEAAYENAHTDYEQGFLNAEWEDVIDAWNIRTWEEYRDFSRTGRGKPLGIRQRHELWQVFEFVQQTLDKRGSLTWNQLAYDCIDIAEANPEVKYPHIVVDEAQDFGPAELMLLNALAQDEDNNLFLVGDSGQRLYQRHFSWSDLGIHVVGRSTRLKINYRTTEEIRQFADAIMPASLPEHGRKRRDNDAISLLHGAQPEVQGFDSVDDEITFVAETCRQLISDGYSPRDIAIFGRVKKQVIQNRAIRAMKLADIDYHRLRSDETDLPNAVSLGTMHAAKGLEFRAVFVMGCDRGLIPLSIALRHATDSADHDDIYQRERNLLYVACTRARERLITTYTGNCTDFLDPAQE